MIRDKISGELKDFAFVEYFTLDEAQHAMNLIKIRNNPIYVTYSKIRRCDEIRVFYLLFRILLSLINRHILKTM
jgi:hypothetical protein